MNWEQIFIMGITMAIASMSYKTYKDAKELKWKMKKLKEDYNVEFRGEDGSASYQKKKYKEQELSDDWRQVVMSEEPHIDGHSIANGMNDPSDVQKKAFNDYTDNMGYSKGTEASEEEKEYWKNK